MAEKDTGTKVEEEVKDGAPEEDASELLSLDNLDAIISEADPDFSQSLGEIGPEGSEAIEIYSEDINTEYKLEDEIKLWSEATDRRQKLIKIFPFLPKISYFYKMKRLAFRLGFSNFKEQAIYRIKNAGPLLLAWFKELLSSFKNVIKDFLQTVGSFSTIKKLAFFAVVLATGPALFLVYKIAKTGVVPHHQELFIGSMADMAQTSYFFEPGHEMDSFYESTRSVQNIFLMNKMIVNLRRSAESGPTPMGAFEFLLEGTASDVVIEIKDRESEIRDLFLRTIEETTFDSVSSGDGKRQLCERLKKEVNKVLTKGFVRRVFIKTAIVKP